VNTTASVSKAAAKAIGITVATLDEAEGRKIQFRYESGANPERSIRIAQTRLRVPELRQQ
jgi:hypothetical protein